MVVQRPVSYQPGSLMRLVRRGVRGLSHGGNMFSRPEVASPQPQRPKRAAHGVYAIGSWMVQIPQHGCIVVGDAEFSHRLEDQPSKRAAIEEAFPAQLSNRDVCACPKKDRHCLGVAGPTVRLFSSTIPSRRPAKASLYFLVILKQMGCMMLAGQCSSAIHKQRDILHLTCSPVFCANTYGNFVNSKRRLAPWGYLRYRLELSRLDGAAEQDFGYQCFEKYASD